MSGIKIPVSADFDASAVQQQLQQFQQQMNALGQQIAQANKVQFNPISKATVEDMRKVVAQFEALRRVSGDLNKRMNATGQTGKGFTDIDWGKLYPDQNARARQMRKAFEYVTGSAFHSPVPAAKPPVPGGGAGVGGGGGGGGGGSTVVNTVTGAAQAGLRAGSGATGGVGGVAANALGTGVSAGVGAGLMGLLGGLLALGVGKIVSAATENIGKAEDNNVSYDKLKRTLGDVNVSFESLKSVITDSGNNLRITYNEAAKLSTEFAKLGNLSASQYKTLAGELDTGVGLSKAYGLDPSQGVGIMGQMRGMRVTTDLQESRKFALLIGETIGRSGAFAKADEVMDAMASYATTQTRNSMGGANVLDYSGMLSGMIKSGIPGMDPAGAASMLARINSTLSAGGAHGEASQFASALVGSRMGLDPLQTQMLREGGAFATNDKMFGSGSAYARYMGKTGPTGNKTFLQGTMDLINEQYAGNSDQAKLLRLQAMGNHLGVNMNQAAALATIKPNQMGEMERYAGDLTKLSGTGIGNLSKVLYGSEDDRKEMARSLQRRTGADALSVADLAKLDQAMKSGSADDQKRVLAELVATRDQEMTTGKAIQESKNALDNIKTTIADKLVPISQAMREGIMYMAGFKDKKTSEQIQADMIKLDSEGRQAAIKGRFGGEIASLQEKQLDLQARTRGGESAIYAAYQRTRPDVIPQKLKELNDNKAELATVEKRIKELEVQREKQISEEIIARDERLKEMRKAIELERSANDAERKAREEREAAAAGIVSAQDSASERERESNRWGVRSGGGSSAVPAAKKEDIAEAMKFFQDKGWSKEQASGIVANLVAESGLSHNIKGDGGMAYGVAQWHPDRQANFKRWAGKDIREATRREQYAFVHYEMTEGEEQAAGRRLKSSVSPGESGAVVSTDYERPKYRDLEARKRAALAARIAATRQDTPLPEAAPNKTATATNSNGVTGEMSVRLDLTPGASKLLRPTEQPMTTRLRPASPRPELR